MNIRRSCLPFVVLSCFLCPAVFFTCALAAEDCSDTTETGCVTTIQSDVVCEEKCEVCSFFTPICPDCDLTDPEKCFVVTNPADLGDDTLRKAIEAANASNATFCEPFVIVFDLEDPITLCGPLPPIEKPVCINGFTNPGADECERVITVEIQPGSCGLCIDCALTLGCGATGSTIKGIAIGGFLDIFELNTAAICVLSSCTLIAANNIGIRADGITPFDEKSGVGIRVEGGTSVVIGGTLGADRNVNSNNEIGLEIIGDGVTVLGNYFGTDDSGTVAIPNEKAIKITGNDNRIGLRACCCGGNLISASTKGSTQEGIGVEVHGNNNRISNAALGTDASGKLSAQLANDRGVVVASGENNLIGFSVFAGNLTNIELQSRATTIIGNQIGIDVCGGTRHDTEQTGILINKAMNSCIGLPELGNIISVGNGNGIVIRSGQHTIIECNAIGTNLVGTGSAGGQSIGILACSAQTTILCEEKLSAVCRSCKTCPRGSLIEKIKQSALAQLQASSEVKRQEEDDEIVSDTINTTIRRNVISGNICAGIALSNSRQTTILCNIIGTNKSKKCAIPNGFGIVFADETCNNFVIKNCIASNNYNGIIAGQVSLAKRTRVWLAHKSRAPVMGDCTDDYDDNCVTGLSEESCDCTSSGIVNSFLDNQIFCNGALGIKLLEGANTGIEAPVLLQAVLFPGRILQVTGTLLMPDLPNRTFDVQLFGNCLIRPDIKEGKVPFVPTEITTDVTGTAIFTIEEDIAHCPLLRNITATATLKAEEGMMFEGTSEFSCPVRIVRSIRES